MYFFHVVEWMGLRVYMDSNWILNSKNTYVGIFFFSRIKYNRLLNYKNMGMSFVLRKSWSTLFHFPSIQVSVTWIKYIFYILGLSRTHNTSSKTEESRFDGNVYIEAQEGIPRSMFKIAMLVFFGFLSILLVLCTYPREMCWMITSRN